MSRPATLLMDLADALFRRRTWTTRREIADAVGTNRGTLTPWLNYLEFFRALRETDAGIEVRVDRLLSTMTAYRAANLRPDRTRRVGVDAEEAHDRLTEAGVDHVFCMFAAANRWTFYEPAGTIDLYVERGDRADALDALGAADIDARRARGGRDPLQLYIESLDGVHHQDREGLPVTTPLQTTIDLRAHPQGGAHADFLEKNLLPRLFEEDA